MAKKETGCDFNAELKKLKNAPPQRIYVLFGEEDYLRDHFLGRLKAKCLPEGEDGFNFKRFDGPGLDAGELSKAVDMLPFLSECTFIELRNVDLNKLGSRTGLSKSSVPYRITARSVLFRMLTLNRTDG